MIDPDRLQLLIAAVAGALVGIVTGILLEREWLGILIWAFAGAVTNYYPKTSYISISAPRERITQTNIILMLICPSACASRFRADTAASKSVGMIRRLLG